MQESKAYDLEQLRAKAPQMRVFGSRILVWIIPEEDEKVGSIIVPATAKKQGKEGLVSRGVVLNVGNTVTEKANAHEQLSVGDVVLFSQYAGSDMVKGVEDFKLIDFTSIFGVEEN